MARQWSSPAFDQLMTESGFADQVHGSLNACFRRALDGVRAEELPAKLYFMSIPAPTLNAFVTRSRRTGTHALVANMDMVTYVGIAVHLVTGLIALRAADGESEYCTHASDHERIAALEKVAGLSLDGLPASLADDPAILCIGDLDHPGYDFHDATSYVAETCVIMHELGHLALDHLDDPNEAKSAAVPGGDLLGFARQRELEADWFAIERMAGMPDTSLLPEDVLFAFGCFFVLLHIRDMHSTDRPLTTHPPGMVRWRSAFDRLEHVRPESMAYRLNYLMDCLILDPLSVVHPRGDEKGD